MASPVMTIAAGAVLDSALASLPAEAQDSLGAQVPFHPLGRTGSESPKMVRGDHR